MKLQIRGVTGKHGGARPRPWLPSGPRPVSPQARDRLDLGTRGGGQDVGRPSAVGMQAGVGREGRWGWSEDGVAPAREARASAGQVHGARRKGMNTARDFQIMTLGFAIRVAVVRG